MTFQRFKKKHFQRLNVPCKGIRLYIFSDETLMEGLVVNVPDGIVMKKIKFHSAHSCVYG